MRRRSPPSTAGWAAGPEGDFAGPRVAASAPRCYRARGPMRAGSAKGLSMASDAEELLELRRRVEALEAQVLTLVGRVESLEAGDGGQQPDFHMAVEAPTV